MSKYDPLKQYLEKIQPTIRDKTLSFNEIEGILGFELPGSAYDHRAWWGNPTSPTDHPYAQSWLQAGWMVDTVNQTAKWVRFRRTRYSSVAKNSPMSSKKLPTAVINNPLPAGFPDNHHLKSGAKKIVLISCVKKKLSYRAKAKDLYISEFFRSSLQYARKLNPDAIYILSAKYGLLELDQEIEPYDLTLNTMKAEQRKAWADQVLYSLKARTDLISDHFIIFAGMKYREYLIRHMHSFEVPLEGLGSYTQVSELKKRLR